MCALNPAVAFGIAILDVTTGDLPWEGYTKSWPFLMFLYYTFVELLGAAVACLLFWVCRQHMIGKGSKKDAPSMVSKFVAEVTGTFVLCLTVVLVCHAPSSTVSCVGIASSLMVMIYALGAVSGANFNPAVSLGLAIAKAISWLDFAIYVVAQILGSLLAVLTAWAILRRIDCTLVAKDVPAGSTKFGAAKGVWSAIWMAEIIFTFVLVFTVLNVAVRDSPNQYYGLAIGFVVFVGAASVGAISGGCFNPAVALALEAGGKLDNEYTMSGAVFSYWSAELLGGAIAAVWYLCISPAQKDSDEYEEDLEEADDEEEMEDPDEEPLMT